jgi:ketosteroid isomerase-like protein
MTAEQNIQLVQKMYASFSKGDVPAILEHVADDIDWGIDSQGSKEIPWHGIGRGKKYAQQFFATLSEQVTFTRFEPAGFVGSNDAVACLVSFDSTLKKNGKKNTQQAIHYFHLKNGRVTKFRFWEDTAQSKALWNVER